MIHIGSLVIGVIIGFLAMAFIETIVRKDLFKPHCPRCCNDHLIFESYDLDDGKKIYKCERCHTRVKRGME